MAYHLTQRERGRELFTLERERTEDREPETHREREREREWG